MPALQRKNVKGYSYGKHDHAFDDQNEKERFRSIKNAKFTVMLYADYRKL